MVTSKGSGLELKEHSVSALVRMIERADTHAESFHYQAVLERKLDNSNVGELASLLQSPSRYCMASALRMIDDSKVTDLSGVHDTLDGLFARDDLGLNVVLARLTFGRGAYDLRICKRAAHFFDSPADEIRRVICIWLLCLNTRQLAEFLDCCEKANKHPHELVNLIRLYKSNQLPLEDFLGRVRKADGIAFTVYEERATGPRWLAARLFRRWAPV
jgi:hypothetical protein